MLSNFTSNRFANICRYEYYPFSISTGKKSIISNYKQGIIYYRRWLESQEMRQSREYRRKRMDCKTEVMIKLRGFSCKTLLENRPQVKPITWTWSARSLSSQVLLRLSILRGSRALSERVTFPRTWQPVVIPGKAVPNLSSRIYFPESSLRCSQR